jgi:hypothetical protein|tara:strand:- start:12 stop:524 length:513 start_codon:yes stop_codon:yes gene_type:complete
MITIIDDFFDKDKYDQVMHHIKTNLCFTPRYFDDTKEKIKENYYGDRYILKSDKNLCNTFTKQAEKKFKLKIHKIDKDSGIDLRNLDKWQPHVDDKYSKINIFIMLDGPIAVTTGTCFYTDNELDIHVGFRPNRAVMFPSDRVHSPHKSEIKNMRRYTASLFVSEYETLI